MATKRKAKTKAHARGGKKPMGFATLTKERHREIASAGGKAAHERGVGHEWSREEAAAAGRKGGLAAARKGTAHRFTATTAAAAGRKGVVSRRTRKAS